MSKKATAAATSWGSAPPVSENGFTFVNGELFVEASGQNRHRRATVAELREHAAAGSDKDKPAHWFEAQLVHYGLKPSKTKAVARMRLLDAVHAGSLRLPDSVSKLEAKLKKEWTKNDREWKKAAGTSNGSGAGEAKKATAATGKAAGSKRKADDDADPSTSKAPSTAKKAKTATPAATPKANAKAKAKAKAESTVPKTEPASPTVAKKQTARRGNLSQGAGRGAGATASASPEKPPRTKQTARRGGLSRGAGRGARATASAPPEPPARPMQTARRGGLYRRAGIGFVAQSRLPTSSTGWAYEYAGNSYDDDDDVIMRDIDDVSVKGEDEDDVEDQSDSDSLDWDASNIILAPLGLLNGFYDVVSEYVESQWDVGTDFSIDLTLQGSTLWGSFDLGIIEGVLLFDERPWQSSHSSVPFRWRGQEREGPIKYGDNHGWMTFHGNGRVEGRIDYLSISFQGRRVRNQGTTGSRTAKSLEDEWNGYSESRYNYENASRWR